MPNYDTICSVKTELPCDAETLKRLQALLEEEDAEYQHGFVIDDSAGAGTAYLYAEFSGDPAELLQAFLDEYVKLFPPDLKFMLLGVAYTSSRMVPGGHGGDAWRIYRDGTLAFGETFYPDAPQHYPKIEDIPQPEPLVLGWYRHYKKDALYEVRFQPLWDKDRQCWVVAYYSRDRAIGFTTSLERFLEFVDGDDKVQRFTLVHQFS